MVDVFTGALTIEVLVPGGMVVVLVEVKTSKGAEVGGFDGVLLFGVSVTGLILDAGTNDTGKDGMPALEVKSAGEAEVGGFDVTLDFGVSLVFRVSLIFGVSVTGLMLDAGTNDAE